MKNYFILLILSLSTASVFAQRRSGPTKDVRNESPSFATLISVGGAYQMCGGDLIDLFDDNFTIGAGVGIKTKTNWIFELDAQFQFGNNILNARSYFNPVVSSGGFIISQGGSYASVAPKQRGAYGMFETSKLLEFGKANANSGPSVGLGIGYGIRWIRIENTGNDSPQILDNYAKGYDRMHGGIYLKQSIGYTYLSNNRRINFNVSLELLEGFTSSLREYNYSSGLPDLDRKLDIYSGIRLRWYIPIYDQRVRSDYYID